MTRTNVSANRPGWDDLIGYSRATRIGNLVEVGGTTANRVDGEPVGGGDAYEQTRDVLRTIGSALEKARATYEDVIRTRVFLRDIERDWEAVGRAHGEVFSAIKPASTFVEVSRFMSDDLLVEIEVTAVVPDRR